MAVVGKHVGPPSGLQLRAYHEAGHAVATLLKGFSLTRVTISRRGRSGGACEYQFRIPRARARSAVQQLARAGAAVALAGSVAQDGAAAERGWMAVDEATGAAFRPFAPGAEDDARIALRFARRVYRSPVAQRGFLHRMRASTEKLLLRPEIWAVVREVARRLLDQRTLCGEHVVQTVLRAMATPGARRRRKAARRRADSSRRARERRRRTDRGAARRSRSSIPHRVSSE